MSELNEEILNYLNTNSELNTLDYSKEKNLLMNSDHGKQEMFIQRTVYIASWVIIIKHFILKIIDLSTKNGR